MIGTTFKIGFDASAVQRGLSHVGGLMSRFGRQVAIGGARQIGAGAVTGITALVDKIASSVPDMLDWTGELVDMSAQTNVAIQDLLVLQRAFELAGASVGDSSKMISVMRKNLRDAAKEDGPVRDALHKIGLQAKDLDMMGPVEQFQKIGQALTALGPEFKDFEDVSTTIFGGKMGYKMIRFFKDMEGSMSQAKNDVGNFGTESLDTIKSLESLGDALSRMQLATRKGMVNLAEGLFGVDNLQKGSELVNQFFDGFDAMSGKIRDIGNQIREALKGAWKTIDEKGIGSAIGGMLENIGESIGKGIMRALSSAPGLGWLSPKTIQNGSATAVAPASPASIIQPKTNKSWVEDLMKSAPSLFPSMKIESPAPQKNDAMLKEMKSQTGILKSIYREGGTAMFA